MITTLQNFFLKHNKWLFGSLLVVIIMTFVLTIGPQSIFDGPQGQQRQKMEFYGYDLASQAQQQTVVRRAELSMAMHPELRIPRDQLMDFAYLRLAGLGMANQLGIPSPDRDSLATFVATISIFQDPESGEFSPEVYNNIVDSLESGGRFSRDTLAATLREDYRIAEVRKVLGGADLSLPSEVEQDYIDLNSEYTFVMAHMQESAFDPTIDAAEEAVKQFFDENPSRYEIPEQIEVLALMFKADAWMDSVAEPTEEALLAQFENNLTRYQPAADPEAETPAPEVTLEDVRERVVADVKRELARRMAEEKSSAFTLQLWNTKVEFGSPEYETMLEDFRVEVVPLAPYSRESAPRNDVPRELLDSMWIYVGSSSRYFSDVSRTANGAAVGILRDHIEARMPSFEEVQAQVASDYASSEKRRLFTEHGRELRAALQSNPAEFQTTAADLGLNIEVMGSFSGDDVPFQIRFNGLWEQIQYLPEGEISPMIINNNRGTFAWLENKQTPAVDSSSAAFAEFADERRDSMKTALGWIRLREITDRGLAQVFGEPIAE